MTEQEAYRAGFILKCASMGIPSGFSQVLLDHQMVQKSALLGTAAALGMNAAIAPLRFSGATIDKAKQLGEYTADEYNKAKTRRPESLSDDALQQLLLAAHYRKARQALLPTKNQ